MTQEERPNPGSFGIEAAVKKLRQHLDTVLASMRQEMKTGFACLERVVETIGTQLDEMNVKLENIANQETQLGLDIQTVVDWFKANPNPTPQDLALQNAKLDAISQKLVDTSASTLANLPPTPPPPIPARRK